MSMRSTLEDYEHAHESFGCKLTHAIGIPLIALAIPMLFINWRRALGFFALGWVLQFAGHALEGNRPKFFEGPEFLVAGLVWWLRLATSPLRFFRSPS